MDTSLSYNLLPPLAQITATDQRGALWVISLTCLVTAALTLLVRVYVRWSNLQKDDYAILAASAIAAAECAVVLAAMIVGLGDADVLVNSVKNTAAFKLFLVSEALWVVVIFTARASVTLTFDRLLAEDMKLFRTISRSTLALNAVFAVGSIIALTVGCGPAEISTPSATDQCGQTPRWTVITILDAVTELWIFALVCYVIGNLQMKTQRKLEAVSLFVVRLGVIIFGVVHIYHLAQFSQTTDSRSVESIKPLIWQQLAACYSLISALVIVLKPFFRDFHTGMLMDVGRMTGSGYATGSNKSPANTFEMGDMTFTTQNSHGDSDQDDDEITDSPIIRGDGVHHHADAYHVPGDDKTILSMDSGSSQRAFIRRDVDYEVTFENRCGRAV